MTRDATRLLAAVGLAVALGLAACAERDQTRFGEPCTSRGDCFGVDEEGSDIEGECVVVDGDEAFCFPPVARDETRCDEAADCIDEGFPVEARCVDGLCACEDVGPGCDADEDFVPARCACLIASGEPCQADGGCASGTCGTSGLCLAAPGDSCFEGDECVSGNCDAVLRTCQ